MRIRAGLSSDKKANTDGYYQHRSQYAEINANASYQQDNYLAVGATIKAVLLLLVMALHYTVAV
ncbi:hypothetical protein IC611_17215 [Proteus mirabilis]